MLPNFGRGDKLKSIKCCCPSCGKLLFEVKTCSGVIVICPQCQSSVKFDVEENGKMKVSLLPFVKYAVNTNNS